MGKDNKQNFIGGHGESRIYDLFWDNFKEVPQAYYIPDVDYGLLTQRLKKEFKSSVQFLHSKTEINKSNQRAIFESLVIFPSHDVVLYMGIQSYVHQEATQIMYGENTQEWFLDSLMKTVLSSSKSYEFDSTGYLEMMVSYDGSLQFKEFEIAEPQLDLETIYPADFMPVHDQIIERLNTAKSKGLIILHGDPGTGKTTYIKHLISKISKRKIFVSPNMTNVISSPSFIRALDKRPNSVLIIEDAESVLMTREEGRNDAVSNLLNLSDGLLADCFNIQIICTFNTPLENIDPALLRKGRLIARYEFPKLSKERAKAIAAQLGAEIEEKEDMSLADVFHPTDAISDGSKGRRERRIGFQFASSDDLSDIEELPF